MSVEKCATCGVVVTGIEWEAVEVTRGPDDFGPGDQFRKFVRGPARLVPCGHDARTVIE